jgi:predicted RNase H-like HicB family nuclease
MISIPYTSQLFEEDGQIVALCLELNVSSFGDTPEEAQAALQEAVTLFLEECRRMGTLEMVLEEAGYRHAPTAPERWLPRRPIEVKQVEIAVA